jgi:hypothetical protein
MAGQQGREQQDKDDTEQRRHRAQPSPKPTTMASRTMKQRMKQNPPLQIKATTTRSNRIPSSLVPMTISKGDCRTLRLGPRSPRETGLMEELRPDLALAAVLHGRRRGERPYRWPTPPVGAGLKLPDGITPKLLKKPRLQTVQGGHLPLS